MVKNLPANAADAGDVGSFPLWGRSPGPEAFGERFYTSYWLFSLENPGREQNIYL